MAYKIAISGVPNFAWLQYIEVEKMEDLFSLFDVRVKDKIIQGFVGELFNKEGKRVHLYLSPESPRPDGAWLARFFMSPSKLDALRLGSFGGGNRPNYWNAISPAVWPTYPAALEEAKKKRQEEARRLQEAEEREEALQAEIDNIIDAKGHAAVLQALKDAGLTT